MKKLALCMVTLLTTLSTTSTVFAGQWYKEGSYWRYTKDYQYAVQDDWINDGGAWYYINPSGFMSTGWKDIKGTWYYFDDGGKMAANCWVGNYYLGSSGAMLTNTTTPDGYKVGVDGAWISGNNATSATKQVSLNEAKAAAALGKHDYYKYCSQEQANQADAVARNIATRVLSDGSLTTDLDKIRKASSIIYREYIVNNAYGTDANKYYRGPYGVFIAGIHTCAGGARALGRVLDFMGYDWEHANPNQWTHQWCIVNMDGKTGYADAMGYGCGFGTHPYISGDMSQVTEDMMRGLY